MGPDRIDRRVPINAAGSDEKVGLSLEQVPKPLQNNRMVVGDDNLDRHRSSAPAGPDILVADCPVHRV